MEIKLKDTVFDKFDNTGKVAVITGGAGLLGREFCKTLAESGAAVVVADRDVKAAMEIATSLEKSGFMASGFSLDVTQQDSVTGLVSWVMDEFSRIDILVNSYR